MKRKLKHDQIVPTVRVRGTEDTALGDRYRHLEVSIAAAKVL